MLKKQIIAALLSGAFLFSVGVLTAQKREVVLDKVVAVVGGSAILHSEVVNYANQLVEQRRAEGYTSDRDPINEGLEMLMKQKLLYNQALIDSITPPSVDSYVEEQLQAMIAEAGSIGALEAREHMAIYNYRELLRQRITEQQYAQSMQQEIVADVVVTPGEVTMFYDTLKNDEKPIIPEQYVYSHIVRFPSSKDEARRRTRERLLDMRERIISGKSTMAVLARTYSVDPGSAMNGGEYPPGPLSQLTPPFADALEKLQPGQISEVVETEFGYHIIELIDEPKNGLYHYRHILLKPVYTTTELMEPLKYLDSLANVIRNDSITFEAAAKAYSEDALTKMNGGLVTNHDLLMNNPQYANVKYTATKFRREDFGNGKSLNDYGALVRLKPGEVSDAFTSQDLRGNDMSKIVKLVEIIPTHTASLVDDYLTIEELALDSKQSRVFDDWMRKQIDGIYVYIDPEYRKGAFEYPNWVK